MERGFSPQQEFPSGEAESGQRMDVYGEETSERPEPVVSDEAEPMSAVEIHEKAEARRDELGEWLADEGSHEALKQLDESTREFIAYMPKLLEDMRKSTKANSLTGLRGTEAYEKMSKPERTLFVAATKSTKKEWFVAADDWAAATPKPAIWCLQEVVGRAITLKNAIGKVAELDPDSANWNQEARDAMSGFMDAIEETGGVLEPKELPLPRQTLMDIDPALPETLRPNAETLAAIDGLVPDAMREGAHTVHIVEHIRSKKEWLRSYAGVYDPATRSIGLAASETNPKSVQIVFHEYGHAVDLRSSRIAAELRLRYLKAMADEAIQHSLYAKMTLAHEGLVSGIHEDFAEAWSYFLTQPEYLAESTPLRYKVMREIFEHGFKDIGSEDLHQLRKDIRFKRRELLAAERKNKAS